MTERHIGFEIRTLSNLIHRKINQMVTEEEEALTPHQAWVLNYLILQGGDQDTIQRDVEKQFSIRRSTASHMLQLMERGGYILRVSVPEDARRKKLVPTQKGISEDELQQFLRILLIMEKNVM